MPRNHDIPSEHLVPSCGFLHFIYKPLIHKYFPVGGKRPVKIAPLNNLHSEDIEPVAVDIIGIPDIEQLPVLSRY